MKSQNLLRFEGSGNHLSIKVHIPLIAEQVRVSTLRSSRTCGAAGSNLPQNGLKSPLGRCNRPIENETKPRRSWSHVEANPNTDST